MADAQSFRCLLDDRFAEDGLLQKLLLHLLMLGDVPAIHHKADHFAAWCNIGKVMDIHIPAPVGREIEPLLVVHRLSRQTAHGIGLDRLIENLSAEHLAGQMTDHLIIALVESGQVGRIGSQIGEISIEDGNHVRRHIGDMLELAKPLFRSFPAQHMLDGVRHQQQVIALGVLGQIVVGAPAHRLGRHRLRAVTAQNDGWDVRF